MPKWFGRNRARPQLFYGWYVVGAMFFTVLMGVGARQGYGLFFGEWTAAFGASVSVLSGIAAVGWLVNGLSQPLVGALADRFGGRAVMGISALVMGLGIIGIGLAPNIVVLGFFYIVIVSFAMSGTMFSPAAATLSRWFRRKRGTALGIMTSGASVGGILLVPLMAFMLEITDWRTTWIATGIIMAFVASPVIFIVVRNDPRAMGLAADGAKLQLNRDGSSTSSAEALGPLAVEKWQTAYRSAPVWQLTMTYVVCGITTATIAVHFVPYAVNEGISARTAALAFAVLSMINMIGVLFVGVISDRILRKNALTVIYAVRGVGFILLLVLPAQWGLWAFAVVGGVSWLATIPATTALAAEIYGVKNAGTINGMLSMLHQFGGALAVFAAGAMFDAFGSYTPAFAIAAGTLVIASLTSWSVRERAYSARFQTGRLATAPEPT